MATDRWQFAWDQNGDGVFTISDVSALIKWLFFFPGDGLIYLALEETPGLARFLELAPDLYGSWLSGIISGVFWLVVVAVIGLVSEYVDEYDRKRTDDW